MFAAAFVPLCIAHPPSEYPFIAVPAVSASDRVADVEVAR